MLVYTVDAVNSNLRFVWYYRETKLENIYTVCIGCPCDVALLTASAGMQDILHEFAASSSRVTRVRVVVVAPRSWACRRTCLPTHSWRTSPRPASASASVRRRATCECISPQACGPHWAPAGVMLGGSTWHSQKYTQVLKAYIWLKRLLYYGTRRTESVFYGRASKTDLFHFIYHPRTSSCDNLSASAFRSASSFRRCSFCCCF